jgi:hypothetical protein
MSSRFFSTRDELARVCQIWGFHSFASCLIHAGILRDGDGDGMAL